MRWNQSALSVVASMVIAVSTQQTSATVYTGSLSTTGGGIVTAGSWVGDTISLAWNVTDVGAGLATGSWRYSYTWTGQTPGLSHFILEVSPNFTENNYSIISGISADGTELNTFGAGPSNPSIPGSIFGIKFDEIGLSTWTVVFDSDKIPVWGDFYAKGGSTSAAWNAGYLDADPTDPASNGSINNHILRPDTITTRVPDAGSTLMLLGTALSALGIASRRLRK
jgi:hypothetical protein